MSRTGIEVFSALQGEGIRLQGLDSKHVLILLDGRRITGRLSGTVDLTRFPIEQIERVEIVRGGSSALYGSEAMAGVVNLITRKAKAPLSFEAKTLYGGLNTTVANGTVGIVNDSLDALIMAGFRRADAYDLTPETLNTTGNAYNEVTLSNNNTFKISDALQVKTHVDYLTRRQDGIETSGKAIYDRTNQTETVALAVEPQLSLPGFQNLSMAAYYNLYRDQYKKDQRNSNLQDVYEETLDQLAQLHLQDERFLGENHILTTGGEIAYERLQADRLNQAYGERVRGALYTQDEWQAFGLSELVLIPGLRMDVDSRYGSNLAPKVAMRYDPTASLTLRASVGSGFRAPDFKELLMSFQNVSAGYEVIGNPNLGPESSTSYNFGLESRLTSWAWLGANLYHNEVSNLIQTQLVRAGTAEAVTQYSYVNVASAMTRGIETSIKIQPLTGLILEPGYTLNDTLDRSSNLALEGRPLHKGTLTARYQHEAWGLGLYARGAWNGERPYHSTANDVTTTTMAAPYTTLEARITKSITEQITAHVQGTNLLDVRDPTYAPMQPLTVLAGLTAKF
ncbi:Colicin I receptor precursor [compost metagenome]